MDERNEPQWRNVRPAPERGRRVSFVRSEDGSMQFAVAFFAAALLALAAFGVLNAAGLLQVPQLIFLVLLLAVGFTGWDVWREWRKQAPDDARDGADETRAGD